jgi:hypothetical protein
MLDVGRCTERRRTSQLDQIERSLTAYFAPIATPLALTISVQSNFDHVNVSVVDRAARVFPDHHRPIGDQNDTPATVVDVPPRESQVVGE